MKKISYLMALTLALVSCSVKETSLPLPEAKGEKVLIRASLAQASLKTTYADETSFSWTEGDVIAVQLINKTTGAKDQWRFAAVESGPVSDFEAISALDTDTWEIGTLAFYPKGNSRSADLTYIPASNAVSLAGTITQDSGNPLSCVPMIGLKQEDGTFHFAPATGIVKFNFKWVPAATAYVTLTFDTDEEEVKKQHSFNGTFTLDGNNRFTMASNTAPWPEKYVRCTPEEDRSLSTYFPIPDGTIPAGSKISFLNGAFSELESVTLQSAITVKRGILTDVAEYAFEAPVSHTVSDIVGTYEMASYDNSIYAFSGSERISIPGDVVIEASDDSSKGNIVLTCFAGVPGKKYGTFAIDHLSFPREGVFGANPYSNAGTHPYVALVAYDNAAVDIAFDVTGDGELTQTGGLNIGFRETTEDLWNGSFNGLYPWANGFTKLVLKKK